MSALPERLREAAETLRLATLRMNNPGARRRAKSGDAAWRIGELLDFADELESEASATPDATESTIGTATETEPAASTLPERMRQAADILEEASARYDRLRNKGAKRPGDYELVDWRPANLRYVAGQFEHEDQDQARKGIIDQLCRDMCAGLWPSGVGEDRVLLVARAHVERLAEELYDRGWRTKGGLK